ncbi:hypothetical protein [Deinococcus sp. Leaf326]|uniref:hypothetical protein n=1 Tax=Deinococcus sp. Leaf326 TaxID=1736338 RepID=UPI0006F34793|nr:hypothetical protein [Deinococcus sp. Leaf326]KQR37723.1 hypothetical protein ASF71_14680 [Deinococcus sp. Leaf326]
MPVLILGGRGRRAPKTRVFSGPVVTATVQRAFSGPVVTATTARVRAFSGVYVSATTLDPNTIPLPPLPDGVGSAAYVVTHLGLPQEAANYSVNLREAEAAARLDATLRGRVGLSGELLLTVAVRKGEQVYRQTYGPFGALAYTYTKTPTGWTTQATSADLSAADTEEDGTLADPFTEEYLLWERENDLTNEQRAIKARNDALAQREARQRQAAAEKAVQKRLDATKDPATRKILRRQLRGLQRQVKPPPDRRHVPVQSVIQLALGALGLPFVLGGPLPYSGDFFWASDDTGVPFNGGILVGTSFQVKGKTPVQVLDELLSPIGWQVVIKFGRAYIGPGEALEEATKTPGLLELPSDLLTGLSIEQVNPEAATGNGNRQLPRKVTLTGASTRKRLAPLPPERDEDGNVTDPSDFGALRDATFSGETTVQGYGADGRQRLESRTTWKKVKEDGLLRREESTTHAMVPTGDLIYSGGQFGYVAEVWQLTEERATSYTYGDGLYPQALTEQITRASAYAEPVRRVLADAEVTRITQEWHAEGWLRRKVTTSDKLGEWHTSQSEDGRSIDVWVTRVQEVEVEEWTNIGAEQWKRTVTRSRQSLWPMYEDGEPADPERRRKTETLVDELTEQGPERAPEPEELPDDEDGEDNDVEPGEPYDEAISAEFSPGGRAVAVTRSAPWATSLELSWLDNIVSSIRRAQPAQRTRYEVAAPPRVEVGTRVKDFNLSGSAGSVRATITVEEASSV